MDQFDDDDDYEEVEEELFLISENVSSGRG